MKTPLNSKKAPLLAVCLTCLLSVGCTNPTDTNRALSSQGYTEINPGGYDWLACGQDDWYHTKFTAKNPQGKVVSGVVCSGLLFKGATVRF